MAVRHEHKSKRCDRVCGAPSFCISPPPKAQSSASTGVAAVWSSVAALWAPVAANVAVPACAAMDVSTAESNLVPSLTEDSQRSQTETHYTRHRGNRGPPYSAAAVMPISSSCFASPRFVDHLHKRHVRGQPEREAKQPWESSFFIHETLHQPHERERRSRPHDGEDLVLPGTEQGLPGVCVGEPLACEGIGPVDAPAAARELLRQPGFRWPGPLCGEGAAGSRGFLARAATARRLQGGVCGWRSPRWSLRGPSGSPPPGGARGRALSGCSGGSCGRRPKPSKRL